MKTVLLTGATGFIGRHALQPLIERGYEIHATIAPHQPPGAAEAAIYWHTVDLLDPPQMHRIMTAVRPSHLLHFAWYVEPGQFWHAVENLRWVEATLALVRAFAAADGRRIVIAGTCAEYDWSQDAICREDQTPLRPATLYGVCKHALHQIVATFAANTGISFAWGRIFWPYGPGEHPSRLVASVVRSLLQGESAPCSHGRQVRDYMYTLDIADAFVALLDSPVTGPVNIATGAPVSIKDVVSTIADQLGRPDLIQLGARESPEAEPMLLIADVTRLQREVNWRPRFDLSTGIAQTITWWRNQQ